MPELDHLDDRIQQRPISSLLSENYLRYMEMTILDRSLPCGLDGQKPGQRRILYVMSSSYPATGAHAKSARIVGKVMGEFHPHGDASIYTTMVRMGQSWSNNIPLVDGQGNFGSLDGDSPAAMRYTEARLHAIGQDALADLKLLNPDREEMVPNYDERIREPSVLPVKLPLLLINGAIGVSAGVATCIPPHNPTEICLATIAMLKDPAISDDALFEIVHGPDFPTGGAVMLLDEMRAGMKTGRGKFMLRGEYEIIPSERRSRGDTILVTSLPYGVATSVWLQKAIEELGDDNLADIKDKSTKTSVHVELILRNGTDANAMLRLLLLRTQLCETSTYNATAILNNAPVVAGVPHFLRSFCEFRVETIYSRIEHQTNKMRDQMVRNLALWVARYDIDAVLNILRNSEDAEECVTRISEIAFRLADNPDMLEILTMYDPDTKWPETYVIGEKVARIIAGEKLTLLAKTELNRVVSTIADLRAKITENEGILADEHKLRAIAIAEIEEIMPHLREERLTKIVDDVPEMKVAANEDVTPERSIVISFANGFIGAWDEGKASKGIALPAETRFTCSNKDKLLVFTNKQRVITLKAGDIEVCDPSSAGRFIGNYFADFADGEKVSFVMPVVEGRDLLFVSREGSVRRTAYSTLTSNLSKGVIYWLAGTGDEEPCVGVLSVANGDTVLLGASDGRAIRFEITDALRCTNSKTSVGVAGMKQDESVVVSASLLNGAHLATQEERAAWVDGTMPEPDISNADKSATPLLTVMKNGQAKIFLSHDIPPQNRGGKGIMCMRERGEVVYIGTIPDSGVFIHGKAVDVSAIKIERSRTTKAATTLNLEG